MTTQVNQPSNGVQTSLLESLGGEAGCWRLAEEFYSRVGRDPILRPLFPGKSRRCATEEFTAFLIQFLGGDEAHTQKRWWLSLHESHARFHIGPAERAAWLKHMNAALATVPLADEIRKVFREFFEQSSAYVADQAPIQMIQPTHKTLAAHWDAQQLVEAAVNAIAAGRDQEALTIAPRFAARPSVFVGLLVKMLQTGRAALIAFVIHSVEDNPALATCPFAGKTLLHYAAGAGCLDVVSALLQRNVDPDVLDNGNHTALYCVANEWGGETGPRIVAALVGAGAHVNANRGVTQATPLHMAARRGHVEIARALLDCGADIHAQDRKGETALQRAMNCRRPAVVQLLKAREGIL